MKATLWFRGGRVEEVETDAMPTLVWREEEDTADVGKLADFSWHPAIKRVEFRLAGVYHGRALYLEV